MRPVTADAAHDASQMSVMTVTSEREKSPVRHPPRAHRGESASACSPTCCSSSDSTPSSPGSLDSVDPRWTSQTVARMYSVNCRYSDCQFSMTSTQKAEEVTYRGSESVGSLCAI